MRKFIALCVTAAAMLGIAAPSASAAVSVPGCSQLSVGEAGFWQGGCEVTIDGPLEIRADGFGFEWLELACDLEGSGRLGRNGLLILTEVRFEGTNSCLGWKACDAVDVGNGVWAGGFVVDGGAIKFDLEMCIPRLQGKVPVLRHDYVNYLEDEEYNAQIFAVPQIVSDNPYLDYSARSALHMTPLPSVIQ